MYFFKIELVILYNIVFDFSDVVKLKNNLSWLIKVVWLENR